MQTKTKPVLVITTGGTFDKTYDVVGERFQLSGESQVPFIAEQAYLADLEFRHLLKIDSLDMDSEDRAEIAKTVAESPRDRIVIVHGTSRMIDTGKFLSEQFQTTKTIVLTGALKPARYDGIEASSNFSAAICAARYRAPGVYIAMHGLVEPPALLRKDTDTGRFLFA